MKVAIIKYNAGNIRSVENALKRLGVEACITADEKVLNSADKIIFPGVGEAANTMEYLHHSGLDNLIRSFKQPVLGICLGMQLLCKHTEEGDVDGLGIFNVDILRFKPSDHTEKVPHMGWNTITDTRSELFKGFDKEEFVYFVHSYYAPLCNYTAAKTDYTLPFSAALQKENFYATQFHPEKSGCVGERILKNFLDL